MGSGGAEDFHEAYLDIIEHYRPGELFVSGGEPLLYEGIEDWLARAAASVAGTIHVFTSYQFSRAEMERAAQLSFPEAVVLNHTPIYFEPERWHRLTRGFPFEVYLDNVRVAAKLKVRKRFKFIVNHEGFHEEIQRFQELVQPDGSSQISLKFINDQGDGLGVDVMRRTSSRLHERLGRLDELLAEAGWEGSRPRTSVDEVREVIETGDVTACPYRKSPEELRLAFYRGEGGKSVLKYRYCPYFPPDFGHRFHLGRDPVEKLGRNFERGPFRDHCGGCRLLNYGGGEQQQPHS